MERYEIAVIGTGPAGVSAAITAKIRNKKLLLLGSRELSLKIEKGHLIQNYPGLPAISGPQLADAMKKHLEAMDIAITDERVNAVYAMGDYFALQMAEGMYEAETVILATGVSAAKPFPGEMELLGRGVSYCATCDAPLYHGKTAAVIAYSAHEEAEAEFLAETADKVYYLPQYPEAPHLKAGIEVVKAKPLSISEENGLRRLSTDNGDIAVNGVFILRESVAPGQLVPGLATEGSRVVVNREMATNIAGCFACGDVVGLPYQYIKSAGEGNVAALSAVNYLDAKHRAARG